mmetsp:Transcript_88726/g.237344  ORF Transcript_88726/g.237344 Transcript_88726/m.237344 type:complete len:270 (+) Transcript_88726:795-1604(+)
MLSFPRSVHFWQCSNPKQCRTDVWPASQSLARHPTCSKCKRPVRPNVLMFNDEFWCKEGRCQAQADRYTGFLERIHASLSSSRRGFVLLKVLPSHILRSYIVCLEIGAGTEVPTVRLEMEKLAKSLGESKLIRINLDQPEIPASLCEAQRAVGLGLPAVEALQRIHEHLELLRSGEAQVVHTLARGADAVANAVFDVVHENRVMREGGLPLRPKVEVAKDESVRRKKSPVLDGSASEQGSPLPGFKKERTKKSKSLRKPETSSTLELPL